MGLIGDLIGGATDIIGSIFGGGNGDADAARAIADSNAQTSREALNWAQTIWREQAPQREAAERRAQEVSDTQLSGMRFAIDQARDLDSYNRTTFRPLEQRFVADAAGFDTAERRAGAAASAAADIDMSAAAGRRANDRALGRAGIAPGSARALALAEDSAVTQAAARGGAMTQAVRNVEQQGYSRMADAVGLGRGLAPTQATQQQIASTSGTAAAGASAQALSATMAGNAGVQQGFNTAINGLSASGNLYNGIANTQIAQDRQTMQNIGQVGQAAAYIFSDKKVKKGTGRMANATKALEEIEQTPVHEGWQYDPAKGGPDDGGQEHIGPMAQDVQRVSGEEAAPGGKVINLPDRMGRMEAAMQAIAKDVKALKKAAPGAKPAAKPAAKRERELEAA